MKHLPFALPEIGEEEINAVTECMRSGWLTTGKYAKQFEEDFARYIGDGLEAVSVNSASMGLQLAMEALGVGEGDEVIIPTYTFSATGMMAVHLGAKPVLVDSDKDTLNIDPGKIKEAITAKTKAIVVVHFAGLACDMDSITKIAREHNLYVIEDAAHALPSTYNGVMIGNKTSNVAVYSFYATKTITTGEGGMIVTANKDIAARCRVMRLHGISRDVFDRYTAKGSNWYYEIVAAGQKCNLTDLAASIGIEQLKKANRFQRQREEIAQRYLEEFRDLPIQLPSLPRSGDTHSWHLFTIRLKPEAKVSREEFIAKMSDNNIGCSVHFIPLHLHPYWKNFLGVKEGDFPSAEDSFKREISLPIYTRMSGQDVDNVVSAVKKILC